MLLELDVLGDESFFLAGLGAFLTAHWAYSYGLASDYYAPAYGVGFVAYSFAAGFFALLVSHGLESSLSLPVAFYAFSIATMLWMAARRRGSKRL